MIFISALGNSRWFFGCLPITDGSVSSTRRPFHFWRPQRLCGSLLHSWRTYVRSRRAMTACGMPLCPFPGMPPSYQAARPPTTPLRHVRSVWKAGTALTARRLQRRLAGKALAGLAADRAKARVATVATAGLAWVGFPPPYPLCFQRAARCSLERATGSRARTRPATVKPPVRQT